MSLRRLYGSVQKLIQRLIRSIRTAYYIQFVDQQKIVEAERHKYRDLGLDQGSGLQKLESTLKRKIDSEEISNHLVLFSALSELPDDISTILEIGTYQR